MPRPGGGSLGHSKHRKAFGSKRHKSGHAIFLNRKFVNESEIQTAELRRNKSGPMYPSIKELLRGCR